MELLGHQQTADQTPNMGVEPRLLACEPQCNGAAGQTGAGIQLATGMHVAITPDAFAASVIETKGWKFCVGKVLYNGRLHVGKMTVSGRKEDSVAVHLLSPSQVLSASHNAEAGALT